MTSWIPPGRAAATGGFLPWVVRSVCFPAAAVLAVGLAGASAEGLEISAADASAYDEAPDFKALAVSVPVRHGVPLVRYSFNYDRPRDAVLAALAYCEEARKQEMDPDGWVRCEAVRLGPYPVEGLDEEGLDRVINRYLEETIAGLRGILEHTNDRAARTSLVTVLQKSGRHAESEALLLDLAEAGEGLARNALAYHWAELGIHLDRALAYADSAVASDQESPSFHDTRGLVLFRLGRLADALAEVQHAVALNAHPIILDHYGDILWAAGDHTRAASAWQDAVSGSRDILFRQRVKDKIIHGPSGPPVFE